MSTIGERFKLIRTELKLAQDDFGEKIGLSKSAVSAVENDKSFVSVDIQRTLFIDFNINLNWLICGEGSMHNAAKYEDVKNDILKEVEKMLAERGIK